jgi:peptidoglycan/LPS O-acetylase OafA/YrhL
MTIYLGLLEPKRISLVSSGDYSYGLFLYGFPIQQATIATLGAVGHHWFVNTAVALPVTFAIAFFSWRYIEKPALGLRSVLIKIEDAGMRLIERNPYVRFIVPVLGVRGS